MNLNLVIDRKHRRKPTLPPWGRRTWQSARKRHTRTRDTESRMNSQSKVSMYRSIRVDEYVSNSGKNWNIFRPLNPYFQHNFFQAGFSYVVVCNHVGKKYRKWHIKIRWELYRLSLPPKVNDTITNWRWVYSISIDLEGHTNKRTHQWCPIPRLETLRRDERRDAASHVWG